jgi:hypothetical protein
MTGWDVRIEALGSAHDRRGFSCGDAELDAYLQRFARQHMASNISRTYVACQGSAILGYYSSVGRATALPLPDKSECRAQKAAPDLHGSMKPTAFI